MISTKSHVTTECDFRNALHYEFEAFVPLIRFLPHRVNYSNCSIQERIPRMTICSYMQFDRNRKLFDPGTAFIKRNFLRKDYSTEIKYAYQSKFRHM